MRAGLVIAGSVVALAAAGAASARTASDFLIGNGDTLELRGTSVKCAAANGDYGAVMVCQRPGTDLRVWVGQRTVFVSRGPITHPSAVASFPGWKP